jgi:hypothetical protein
MPRVRSLKPSFFTHEVLGEMSPLHRILFEGLWCYADREGRLEDRPKYLKQVILPYDDCDVEPMLAALAARGFIVRYEVDGVRLIWVRKFLDHQKPYHRENPSKLPPPPEALRAEPEPVTAIAVPKPGSSPNQSRPEPGKSPAIAALSLVFGLGSGLGSGLGEETYRAPAAQSAVGDPPPSPKEPDKPPSEPAKPSKRPKRKEGHPRFVKLRDDLVAAYGAILKRAYSFDGGKDGSAVRRLIGMCSDDEEIIRRWCEAISLAAHPGTKSIAVFAARFNEYVGKGPPQRKGGYVYAQDVDWKQEAGDAPF